MNACRVLAQAPSGLSNLLPLRQRNRRTCYDFPGLGIEDLHYLSMIPIVERTRLRPPVQLFQPLSHLISARFTRIAMFTVWTVDFQKGQQVASQIHDPPRRIRVIRLTGCCVPRSELLFGEAERI